MRQEVSPEAQQEAGCEGSAYSSSRHSRVSSWAPQAKRFAFLRENWGSHEEGGLEGDPAGRAAVAMVQSERLVRGPGEGKGGLRGHRRRCTWAEGRRDCCAPQVPTMRTQDPPASLAFPVISHFQHPHRALHYSEPPKTSVLGVLIAIGLISTMFTIPQ